MGWVIPSIILPDREIGLLWRPAENLGEIANRSEILVVVPSRERPPHLTEHGTPTAKVYHAVVLGIGGVRDGERGTRYLLVLLVGVYGKPGANSSILVAKLPVKNWLDV